MGECLLLNKTETGTRGGTRGTGGLSTVEPGWGLTNLPESSQAESEPELPSLGFIEKRRANSMGQLAAGTEEEKEGRGEGRGVSAETYLIWLSDSRRVL